MPTDMGTNIRVLTLLLMALLAGCAAEQHHRQGMQAIERRDFAHAVLELRQAAELKPGDLEYRKDWLRAREAATDKLLANAASLLAEGDRKSAEFHFREVLRYDRDNARAIMGLDQIEQLGRSDADAASAREALKTGDVMRASELVARALKGAPAHKEALEIRREVDALNAQELMMEPSLGVIYRKPIDLEFRDASIKMVFDALSRSTGINFIFDREVRAEQRTTVFLKQTSIDDAIGLILSTSQLEKKVLNTSSVLIYPNTPAKSREYQDLIVRAFYLSNVEAKHSANMLKTVLKIKDVFVDDRYNMIVLREAPETIALAEKLIRLHDLEEPEVMLEVEVLEINRSRLLNAGIQWSSALTVSPLGGTTTSNGSSSTSVQTMKLSDLRSLTSERIGITVPSATINLQKVDGDANLLANPRIRVRDREKAKIMIGDKVPVVTTTSTNTFVTENIQYLDVGLKLEVEPVIHLQDEVGLKLGLEVSSLVSQVKTNNGSQAYQIGTRNFSTSLRLKNGETQVLAGLISDEDRTSASKVPLVGDLPILGRLFGSQNDNRQKTEIVLSITPHLIRNIQRKDPSLESFWSGTEAGLRNRPLMLRDPVPATAIASAMPAAGAMVAAAVPVQAVNRAGSIKLEWDGLERARVGDTLQLQLKIDSADSLKGTAVQIVVPPDLFDIIEVQDGGYMARDGKGSFSKSIDEVEGRIAVGVNGGEGASVKGGGKLVALKVRTLKEAPEAQISVIGFAPIGAERSVSRPVLPVAHKVKVTR
jgi:general secretion pathway protein D